MKTRASILVAAVCSLASSPQRNVSPPPTRPSHARPRGKHAAPGSIFDPLGLVSASQHEELTTLRNGVQLHRGPRRRSTRERVLH